MAEGQAQAAGHTWGRLKWAFSRTPLRPQGGEAGRRWGGRWCPWASSQAPRPAELEKGRGLQPCSCPCVCLGLSETGFWKDWSHCHLFCLFRLFSASGDMRTNGDKYLYEIQLSSITSSRNPACSGANICQVKPNDQHFSRKVGTSDKTKYYVQGNCFRRCSVFTFFEGGALKFS